MDALASADPVAVVTAGLNTRRGLSSSAAAASDDVMLPLPDALRRVAEGTAQLAVTGRAFDKVVLAHAARMHHMGVDAHGHHMGLYTQDTAVHETASAHGGAFTNGSTHGGRDVHREHSTAAAAAAARAAAVHSAQRDGGGSNGHVPPELFHLMLSRCRVYA